MLSIVITTYNRANLLGGTLYSIFKQKNPNLFEVIVVDDGNDSATPALCNTAVAEGKPLVYVKMVRQRSEGYNNPARVCNTGLRRAAGADIILQNAECEHQDPETIAKLLSQLTDTTAVFAKVTALTPEGEFGSIYCGRANPRPYFFCGALRKAWFEKLRGFDEDFVGYGYDDDDFAFRLKKEGVKFIYTEVDVIHKWHPSVGDNNYQSNATMYLEKQNGPTERNLNREWGRP